MINDSISGLRKSWLVLADAQTDLGLRCPDITSRDPEQPV